MDRDIQPINQQTIECDLRTFTLWLNKVVDQVNYLTNVYDDLKVKVESNTNRICELETRMDRVEERVTRLEECCEEVKAVLGDLTNINQALNMINGRIDFLYDLLPVPYGMLPAKGWKFSMGNINIMTGNGETAPTDTSGYGVFTSGDVEDEDLYFN